MTIETRSETAADARAAALADELDDYLDRHVVALRLPAAIDRDGWGFRAQFDESWQPLPETSRFLVYQARLAWTGALLLERRPAHAALALETARHGVDALEHLRDPATGLYDHRQGLDGRPVGDQRHLYSQAFALLALAALGRAGELGAAAEHARERALELFERIETVLRLPGAGAYRRSVALDGSPLAFDPDSPVPASNALWGPAGWIDLNSHLHLLEAYTELHRTVRRADVAAALAGLLELLGDRFYAGPGCLHLQLDAELRPVPGGVSYGHDIEAAELLCDAADALGVEPGAALRGRALRLAEHALALGWDPHLGIWTERGSALGRSDDLACGWWVAFEALHTCSSFAVRYPARRARFERAFLDTWSFVLRRLTDDERGGIWNGFDSRGHLLRQKSGDWFATYHAARALVSSADRQRAAAR